MLKRKEIGLDFANWGVDDIHKQAEGILDDKRKRLAEIKKIDKKNRNFENTIKALEFSDYELSDKLSRIDFLMYVSPIPDIRNEAEKVSVSIRKELIDLEYDKEIWKAIKEYKSKREKLNEEDKKLLDDYYLTYKRRGLDLSEKDFKRLLSINKGLTELSTKFEKNINEYRDFILISDDEIEGLPDTYLKTLKREKNKYKITLSYPDYFPFMEYSLNEKRRKELSGKFVRRASKENTAVMKKILKLRYEAADLLGYSNPADYILEIKMAKTSKAVVTFLKDIEQKIRSGAKNDLKLITEEKRRIIGKKSAELFYHDTALYSRLLKERVIGLNKEEVKKYFQFDQVKNGVFEVYSKLLGVDFKKVDASVWHEDVELYKIVDKKRIAPIAYFFMDMFPRQGKYGHAAAFSIIEGRKEKDGYVMPVSALVMNVPQKSDTQPSLLSHGEVTTFFHEFGHIMHQCLTEASYLSHSGTSVAGDFVEAPSQIFENWAYLKEVLGKITSHVETGDSMPQEMMEKIIRSKNFLEPYLMSRQLVFGFFDMEIHTKMPETINGTYLKHWKKMTGIEMPKGANYPAGFGHFVGYQAGYYGYLWSLVYAYDMFSVFEKNPLKSQVGQKYRKEILSKGSSRPEMASLVAFLGRRPNNKAFLKYLGL